MAATYTQKTIAITRIDADPNQPRKEFDQALLEELAASLRAVGLLQPIRVRYNQATRRYTIIAGERRWRAAQLAGLTELPAVVEHGEADASTTFLKQIAENTGRADMTPLEEAEAFSKAVNELGVPLDEVARMCGKSAVYVEDRINLLGLSEASRDALAKGLLPIGLAWYTCRLTPAAQQTVLVKWVRGEFATQRDAERFAQSLREVESSEQGVMFAVSEPTEEEKQQIRRTRARVTSKVDQLDKAGAILEELANMDPTELARVLAGVNGGPAAYQKRVDALRRTAAKAVSNLGRAAALLAAAVEMTPGRLPLEDGE